MASTNVGKCERVEHAVVETRQRVFLQFWGWDSMQFLSINCYKILYRSSIWRILGFRKK